MLREIFVLRGPQIIFNSKYSSVISWETFSSHLASIFNKNDANETNKVHQIMVDRYKLSFMFHNDLQLIFILVTDVTEKDDVIETQIKKAKNEFIDLFPEDLIISSDSMDDFKAFTPITDAIHRELRPKIAICGYGGVGKTTITKLIKADEIPTEHIPTISGEISTIKIGKLHFYLWDFAGQEQFSFLWPQFLKGSDAVLLVTDSTLNNIDKSRYFLKLVKNEVPNARFAVIANKQDIPNSLSTLEIESFLNLEKVHGMIAIDPNNRIKMLSIIAEVLEISEIVSPLLKPLFDRDRLIHEAEAALEKGNLGKAARDFKAIAQYSMELGDDKLAQEFFDREKAMWKLIQEEKVTPKPVAPTEAPKDKSGLDNELMKLINQEYLELSEESQSIKKGIDGLEKLFNTVKNKIELLEANFSKGIISEYDYKNQKVGLLKKSAELKESITKLRFKLIDKKIE